MTAGTAVGEELRRTLLRLAERYETPAFMANDPSRFMHMVEGDANRETTAFVAAALSFGNRAQFGAKIDSLLDAAGGDMFKWIAEGAYARDFRAGDARCFYRFHTRGAMRRFFDVLRAIVSSHGSLGAFARANAHDGPSAAAAFCAAFADGGGLVPKDPRSACKRVCMFLRWMSRDGSPVDLGLWSGFIGKATLAMPLDVHVLRQSRRLGLARSRTASMHAALALSRTLAQVFPGDPLRGDFALFGLGVSGEAPEGEDARTGSAQTQF